MNIAYAAAVLFYTALFAQWGHSASDWSLAFRGGALGNGGYVVTPYWSLFLSWLPAHLPEPLGYAVWVGVGAVLVWVAARHFGAPLLGILLAYQFHWVLFYGQIDPYIIGGLVLGDHARRRARPWIIGIAIALLLIKPQFGALPALYFFWHSPHRAKTALVTLAIVAASLVVWPGWPLQYIAAQSDFLTRPNNIGINTQFGVFGWFAAPLGIMAVRLPIGERARLQTLVAAGLLLSPYSTVYSQLTLLCLGLPRGFYLFALLPWAAAAIWGPFGNWHWAAALPLGVLFYNYVWKKPEDN